MRAREARQQAGNAGLTYGRETRRGCRDAPIALTMHPTRNAGHFSFQGLCADKGGGAGRRR